MKLMSKQNTGDYLNSEFGYTKGHLTDGGKAAVGLTYASNDESSPEYNEVVYKSLYTLPEVTVKAPDMRAAKATRERGDYKPMVEFMQDAIGSVGPWAPVYWGYKGGVGLKEGVPRTYNYAKNGQWGDAALSLGDNILNGLTLVPAVGEGLRVGDRILGRLSPAYNKVRAARELANEINEAIKIRSELSAGDLGYVARNSERVANEWNLANRIDRATTEPDAMRTSDEIMRDFKELNHEIRLNPEEVPKTNDTKNSVSFLDVKQQQELAELRRQLEETGKQLAYEKGWKPRSFGDYFYGVRGKNADKLNKLNGMSRNQLDNYVGKYSFYKDQLLNPNIQVGPWEKGTVIKLDAEHPYIPNKADYVHQITTSDIVLPHDIKGSEDLYEFAKQIPIQENASLFMDKDRYIIPFRKNLRLHGFDPDFDANLLSDDVVANLIAYRYNELVKNQKGIVRGTVFTHGVTSPFSKFDYISHSGSRFGNGLMGDGNYFSLDSTNPIYVGGKTTRFGDKIEGAGVHIPMLINNIDKITDNRMAIMLGRRYAPNLVGGNMLYKPEEYRKLSIEMDQLVNRSNAIESKVSELSNMIYRENRVDLIPERDELSSIVTDLGKKIHAVHEKMVSIRRVNNMINDKGSSSIGNNKLLGERFEDHNTLFSGYNTPNTRQEFVLPRDYGIKSIFSLPTSLYRGKDGKLRMMANWNDPNIFRQALTPVTIGGAAAYSGSNK